jgi:hypothetical protein
MTASNIARRFAGAAVVLGLAACGDSPTAPVAAAQRAPQGLNFALLGQASTVQGDTTTTRFTVDPTSSTTFQVGSAHAIYFPAHAICDPSVSSYGPGEWDQPCTALDQPLVITAKSWVDAQGLPQVDFSPSLRFTPGLADGVQLALAVDAARLNSPQSDLHILWCASPTATCINEELSDPSLGTWVSPFATAVYRRIKHFSGYNVSSGRLDLGYLDLGLSLTKNGNDDAPTPSRTGHLMSSGRN